jgi:hypothetical protein
MTVENKIQMINNYVDSFLFRHGFTSLGKVSLDCKFWLTNINPHNATNYFEVISEKEAKQVSKTFLVNSFKEDIFKDYLFDETKPLYLVLDIKLPS